MTTAHLTYGESLPDQVEHVAGLSDAQSYIFNDIRDLYRDRAYLEREYATKLQALGKKAVEKKARKMSAAVVGAEPTKAWSEETLNASTIEATYAQVISSILTTAQDHIDLADALNMQVIEPLRTLERRNEDHRKKLAAFYQKLLSDRDRVFSERSKYDAECEEIEEYRQKQDRASDDKHVERAARQFEQQKADMLNAKNVYLITIATANTVQSRFYKESLPALENQHQLLQTQTAKQFVDLMKHAQELQATNQDVLKSRVKAVESALSQVDPPKDQALFIEHNVRPFTEPSGYQFQPNQSHYDTADMSIESAPKIYLQNRLSKMRGKLQELLPLAETKRKEADQAMGVLVAYSNNRSLGSVADAMDAYLETHNQATLYEDSKAILETEIKLLEDALRGDEGSQSPHQFKSSPFTIPTECAYCRTNIWGLSKQGKTCKLCGLSVHAKCELKVAADCTRTRGGGKIKSESSLSRSVSSVSTTSSVLSTRSITLTPTPSSFAQNRSPEEDDRVKARVLFSFSPTSPFELAVQESTIVMIIEEDDGSGWVKVDDGRGGKGLVPASYIEPADESTPNTPTAAATVANSAGSGIRVKGLYDYQATGTDELDVTVGGIIELTPGGDNYAEGWWEGIDSSGKKGIFPSNYVAPV